MGVPTRKRIGYAKLGRVVHLDPSKMRGHQADVEAHSLLIRLAERNPDVEWVLAGKNTAKPDTELPPNVTNLWLPHVPNAPTGSRDNMHICSFCDAPVGYTYEFTCCAKGQAVTQYQAWAVDRIAELDGFVMHLGQHGSTQTYVPKASSTWEQGDLARPLVSQRNYAGYLIQGLNKLGDRTNGQAPVSWLCPDVRNRLAARDLKWTTGTDRILAQMEVTRRHWHDRHRDPRTPDEFGLDVIETQRGGERWRVEHRYTYSAMELLNVPADWRETSQTPWDERVPVGVGSTASRDDSRGSMVVEYVVQNFPDAPLFGAWDKRSLELLPEGHAHPERNDATKFQSILAAWRSTIALPAHKPLPGWATAKPWQAFAARAVCFFPDTLDEQGWILPTRTPDRTRDKAIVEVAPGLWSMRTDWTADDLALAGWLRVNTPAEFKARVEAVAASRDTWEWLTTRQVDLLERRLAEHRIERLIEHQQGLTGV